MTMHGLVNLGTRLFWAQLAWVGHLIVAYEAGYQAGRDHS